MGAHKDIGLMSAEVYAPCQKRKGICRHEDQHGLKEWLTASLMPVNSQENQDKNIAFSSW